MVSNSRLGQPMSCFDFLAARVNIGRLLEGGCVRFDLFEHIGSEKVKKLGITKVSPDRTRSGFGFLLVSQILLSRMGFSLPTCENDNCGCLGYLRCSLHDGCLAFNCMSSSGTKESLIDPKLRDFLHVGL
jgi:hypothetical protein